METVLFVCAVGSLGLLVVLVLAAQESDPPAPNLGPMLLPGATFKRALEHRGVHMEWEQGPQTRLRLALSQIRGGARAAARQAEQRLVQSGARLDQVQGQLVISWEENVTIEERTLEDVLLVASLYPARDDRVQLEVDSDGRLALPLPDPERGGRSRAARQAEVVQDALERLSREPVEAVLDSLSTRERARLYEVVKDGPLLPRLLPALLADPDLELAWKVARAHGQPEHWADLALRYKVPSDLREVIGHRLAALGTEVERCQAAARFAADPELHAQAWRLLGESQGEEAEIAWMALAQTAVDPALQRQVVERLAVLGTKRSLPALYALQERLSPLQFQLKSELVRALEEVRARSGGVAGALSLAAPGAAQGGLSLAEPVPDVGAVSLASEPGRLSRTEGPEGSG